MANWLYDLRIKHLFADQDRDPDEVAISESGSIARAIRRVANKARQAGPAYTARMGDLPKELDEVAMLFDDIAGATPDTRPDLDPEAEFNRCLMVLYGIADRGHRVWVN